MRTRVAQQQRNLSIHEYLSANLLKSVRVHNNAGREPSLID
jgi:hypothetical protein